MDSEGGNFSLTSPPFTATIKITGQFSEAAEMLTYHILYMEEILK